MPTTREFLSPATPRPGDDLQVQLQAWLPGRYTLERELGRGGMATVFLARDLKHKRLVAFKVLRAEIATALGPDHFHREIEIAARLQHPHILTVLDSGEAGGQLWFTMPYVEGRTLRDRLHREHQLPVDDALRITREAAAALDYAHEHGIVHRDVKPENILLTQRGEVLVADFGIARALGGEDSLAHTGLVVGTPAYMSPEQASGGAIDGRSDVYSLGCVLYEMLGGRPPYSGPTAKAMVAKRLGDSVPSVRDLRPCVPEAADRAIQRALAPVAADRFPTARAFAQTLQLVVIRPTPTLVTPATASARPPATAIPAPAAPSRGRGRYHVPLALVTLGLGFAIGVGVLFAWRFTHVSSDEGGGPKRLAVLPFENLGDSADAYFADGITDELRGRLATVPGLEVVAGRSSNEYRGTKKRLSEVARDLGVDYILLGKVRRQREGGGASRVRVTPELVRVTPGSAPITKWEQPFDAALTDVFQVEVDIAGRVTQSINGALDAGQPPAPSRRPTTSTDAYDYYLRANEYYARETMADVQLSVQLYQRALGFDSSFALAWARLARAEAFVYWFAGDRSTAQLARIEQAARKALGLAPDLPEAHIAMGYYHYWGHRDYPAALAEFASAAKRERSNAEVAAVVGLVLRRQGKWAEAVASLKRAAGLDPRSVEYLLDLAHTYFLTRHYSEAERVLDRASTLAPDSPDIYAVRMATYLNAEGSLDQSRRLMREALTRFDFSRFGATHTFGNCLSLVASDDAYQADVARLTPAAFNGVTLIYFAFKASVYRRRGDVSASRAYADSARGEALAVIRRREGDVFSYTILAVENAYLGRAEEAVEAGQHALEVLPPSRDAVYAPESRIALAQVYMVLGNTSVALDHLRAALAVPSYLSKGRLRADPLWAPLKRDPRFQRLVAEN
jgi:serine/threonine protein kinase/TolB-like protein/tetratricopeptide (TPR) repeat protein